MSKPSRGPGQKLISVPVNEEFLKNIDAAIPKVGYSDRSSFIRDAIVEKFHKEGVKISIELSLAPSRTGKAGRPRVKRATPKKVLTKGRK